MKNVTTTKTETNVKQKNGVTAPLRAVFALAILGFSMPGYCQLAAMTGKLNTFSTWLYSIAAIVTTMALMWCGFKMFKRGEGFEDIKGVFIGGIVIGAAAGIAGWIVA